MAVPSVVKTYQFAVNNLSPGGIEHDRARELLLQIKNILCGFGTLPWDVDYSCTGSVAGSVGDGVDRWTLYTDLLWGTGAHSWSVLNLPGGQQLLLDTDFGTTTCEDCNILISPSGAFTGGDTSNRPTATDEQAIIISTASGAVLDWSGTATNGTLAAGDVRIHAWHSTDGTHTRLALFRSDICVSFWEFGIMADKRTAQTSGFYAGILVNINASTPASVFLSSYTMDVLWRYTWSAGGTAYRLRLLTLGIGNQPWTEQATAAVAEEWDGDLHVTPLVLWCDTVGARGFKGTVVDMWMSPYQALNIGDNSPNTPSARDFVHMEAICLPWTGDATVMLTA